VQGAKLSKSPRGIPQQSSGGQWDNIVKFLDSLMSKLRGNHVCFIISVVLILLMCLIHCIHFSICCIRSYPLSMVSKSIDEF